MASLSINKTQIVTSDGSNYTNTHDIFFRKVVEGDTETLRYYTGDSSLSGFEKAKLITNESGVHYGNTITSTSQLISLYFNRVYDYSINMSIDRMNEQADTEQILYDNTYILEANKAQGASSTSAFTTYAANSYPVKKLIDYTSDIHFFEFNKLLIDVQTNQITKNHNSIQIQLIDLLDTNGPISFTMNSLSTAIEVTITLALISSSNNAVKSEEVTITYHRDNSEYYDDSDTVLDSDSLISFNFIDDGSPTAMTLDNINGYTTNWNGKEYDLVITNVHRSLDVRYRSDSTASNDIWYRGDTYSSISNKLTIPSANFKTSNIIITYSNYDGLTSSVNSNKDNNIDTIVFDFSGSNAFNVSVNGNATSTVGLCIYFRLYICTDESNGQAFAGALDSSGLPSTTHYLQFKYDLNTTDLYVHTVGTYGTGDNSENSGNAPNYTLISTINSGDTQLEMIMDNNPEGFFYFLGDAVIGSSTGTSTSGIPTTTYKIQQYASSEEVTFPSNYVSNSYNEVYYIGKHRSDSKSFSYTHYNVLDTTGSSLSDADDTSLLDTISGEKYIRFDWTNSDYTDAFRALRINDMTTDTIFRMRFLIDTVVPTNAGGSGATTYTSSTYNMYLDLREISSSKDIEGGFRLRDASNAVIYTVGREDLRNIYNSGTRIVNMTDSADGINPLYSGTPYNFVGYLTSTELTSNNGYFVNSTSFVFQIPNHVSSAPSVTERVNMTSLRLFRRRESGALNGNYVIYPFNDPSVYSHVSDMLIHK